MILLDADFGGFALFDCDPKDTLHIRINKAGDAHNFIDFTYNGDGANYCRWDFGDGYASVIENPSHEYTADSVYFVKLNAESGPPDFCSDSMTKMLETYPELQVYSPIAFSPNSDNLNDIFKLFGVGLYCQIYIFSSNGTQMFYADNIENSWDGNRNGEKCKAGVSTFIIIAKDLERADQTKKRNRYTAQIKRLEIKTFANNYRIICFNPIFSSNLHLIEKQQAQSIAFSYCGINPVYPTNSQIIRRRSIV